MKVRTSPVLATKITMTKRTITETTLVILNGKKNYGRDNLRKNGEDLIIAYEKTRGIVVHLVFDHAIHWEIKKKYFMWITRELMWERVSMKKNLSGTLWVASRKQSLSAIILSSWGWGWDRIHHGQLWILRIGRNKLLYCKFMRKMCIQMKENLNHLFRTWRGSRVWMILVLIKVIELMAKVVTGIFPKMTIIK